MESIPVINWISCDKQAREIEQESGTLMQIMDTEET